MKKSILLIAMVVFLTMSINDVFAQRIVKKFNQSISSSPIGIAFGKWNLVNYEQAITAENSFTAGLVYWNYSNDWSAIGFSGSYRWYIFQDDVKMLKGLSFGPLVNLGFWSDKILSKQLAVSVGGEISYKWIFDGFVVEPNLQFDFNVTTIDRFTYRPFTLGVNLGYAW